MSKVAAKNPPPACNTGVENKSLSQKVDWLEVTFKRGVAVSLPPNLPNEYLDCKPFHGYTVGVKFADHRVELTNPERPEMGTHIVWGGGALEFCPIDRMELIKWLREHGATFTRIDLALDARNYQLLPMDATRAIADERVKTRAKKFPAWHDAKLKGYTQYVGTKSSEIYLRIYDKAAELGVKGDYTRVELVCRKARAQGAVNALLSGVSYQSLIAGYVVFEGWEEWGKIMADFAVNLPSEKKDSNTKMWLLKQCAPALASVILEDGDDEFYFKFIDIVRSLVTQEREIA